MDVFVLIISRVVPMLFIASLTLVLARVSFDIVARRDRRAAFAVFALIGVLGALLLVPGIIRLRLMASAARACERGEWRAGGAGLSGLGARGGGVGRWLTWGWV